MPSFKTENALLLSAKPLGERSWLLSVLTPENGRFCGVLKTKQPPHVGSFLSLRWQARLNEQLGTFYLDDAKAFFIDFLDDKIRLYILSSVCVLLTELLPERQKEDDLYEQTIHLLQNMAQSDILVQYIKWELASSILWIVIFTMGVIACLLGIKTIKKHLSGSYIDEMWITFCVFLGLGALGFVAGIATQAFDITRCFVFPELELFEFLKETVNSMTHK